MDTELRQACRKGNCARVLLLIYSDFISVSNRINTENILVLKSIFESIKTCKVAYYEYTSLCCAQLNHPCDLGNLTRRSRGKAVWAYALLVSTVTIKYVCFRFITVNSSEIVLFLFVSCSSYRI